MMQIICDRCGTAIEEPKKSAFIDTKTCYMHFSLFTTQKDEVVEGFDLCAHCAEILHNWLRMGGGSKEGQK